MLGVTQASVSLYLSTKPESAYASLADLSLDKEHADTYAALLAEDIKRNPVEGVGTLTAIWTDLLGQGSVCGMHRRLYPSLADCDVCIKQYGHEVTESAQVVAEVAEALNMLTASTTFVSVMPEVSVNLACVIGNGTSPADVVAVPGRIVRVGQRARAMLPPESGASRHLSTVLLMVRERIGWVRACMNIRYDRKVGRVLAELGQKPLQIGGYPTSGPEDPTVRALALNLARSAGNFDYIADHGTTGIEPNAYLFGKGAGQVVKLALRVSRLYSSS